MRNPAFCKCENKDADQLRGAFVFATQIQLLKAYRIKFQKFAAHAHKDDLIKETFIPTYSQFSSLSLERRISDRETRVRSSAGSVCLFP